MAFIGRRLPPPDNQTGTAMKSTGEEFGIQKVQAAETGFGRAIVACLTFTTGTLGAVMVAAGPWVLLGWYL